MSIPDCSKYGATKSMTSSRSDVIVNAATAISVSYTQESINKEQIYILSLQSHRKCKYIIEIFQFSKTFFTNQSVSVIFINIDNKNNKI